MELNKYKDEKREIEEFLAKPDAYSDPNYATKARRLSELEEIIGTFDEIERLKKVIAEAKAIIADGSDAELIELARLDETESAEKLKTAEAKLEELLIPRDPDDDKPAIVEIRAGAGGDEASLFAGELYRMYQHYAEKHGLKIEQVSISENEAGGVKEVVCRFSGERPYGQLKFEGGVHRVQRVPLRQQWQYFRKRQKMRLRLSQKILGLIFIVLADTVARG